MIKTDKKILKSRGGDKITVTADVRNTGPADGEIIVQLYTRQLIASVTRPVKELKGFKRIDIKGG